MVGGASTLLNAGKTTNFVFKVNGYSGNLDEVNGIATRSKIRDRISRIQAGGGNFEFSSVADAQFERNMRMIDTALPEFLAHMVFDFFTNERRTVAELTQALAENDVVRTKYRLSVDDYSYKVRHFLDAVALGMVPSRSWDGFMRAHGGYIVVKENGEVICYHLYNRDEFQLYLYENTRFEAASSTRHRYGVLYEKDGEMYFNLNLQIRFLN
jgi:type II restriction enzyme